MFWSIVILFALCNGLLMWKVSLRNIRPSERPLILHEHWFELVTNIAIIGWFAVPIMFGWKHGVLAAATSLFVYSFAGWLLHLLVIGWTSSTINLERMRYAKRADTVNRDTWIGHAETSIRDISIDDSAIYSPVPVKQDFGSPALKQRMRELREKREAAALKAQQQMRGPREHQEAAPTVIGRKQPLWILNRTTGHLIRRSSGKSFTPSQYYRDGAGYVVKTGHHPWAADDDIEILGDGGI